MKAKAILYWVTTGFLAFNVLSGGVAELLRLPGNVEGMIFLGYPVYFMIILGVWKVLATIALLVPSFPRLKEWAYAGLFFDLIGAVYSNAAVDGFKPEMTIMILPIAFLFISRHYSHKIGNGKQDHVVETQHSYGA